MNTDSNLTFRQVRNVSGFSRPMSVTDAFIYNFLAMGIIFPWTYLWGPASFPGSNIELGIWLTLLAQIPISLAYCFLATVLPVNGGDYIYQTRAFGKWGYIFVLSGFVIWILQWVALSGWLFATLGVAPWLLSVGVISNNQTLCAWGLAVQTPGGVFAISIALALVTTLFLIRGLRLYVRAQRFLFVATITSVLVVIYVFISKQATFSTDLNAFVNTLTNLSGLKTSPLLSRDFFTFIQSDVTKAGFNISPTFSFLATLGIIPIAWTSLQWATYSVEQNTEISEADHFWKQLYILMGSAVLVTIFLWLIAHFEHIATTKSFMVAASAAYWLQIGSPDTVSTVKTVVQPFPNILAMAACKSLVLTSLIALGFLANAFQVACNCFIGATRILVAMGTDGFHRPLHLEKVNPVWHAPLRAHWFYFFASIPFIVAYNFLPNWVTYSLGVTFACGYVFTVSSLAATRIPSKLRSAWITSDIHNFKPWIIKTVGYVGFGSGATMVLSYLIFPQLGITGTVPYLIVFGIGVFAYAVYVISKARSPLIEKTMEQVPDEVDDFYR